MVSLCFSMSLWPDMASEFEARIGKVGHPPLTPDLRLRLDAGAAGTTSITNIDNLISSPASNLISPVSLDFAVLLVRPPN